MSTTAASLIDIALKSALVMLFLNELRGFVLAVPILYGMYLAGGSLMAIWLGFCSLAGVALSVIVPAVAARRLGLLRRFKTQQAEPA
jgi:hypothetical protein